LKKETEMNTTLPLRPAAPPREIDPTGATPRPGRARALGALLIADGLLAFAPVVILGAAIGWPASLDLPAAEQLAAIHANAGMVAFGYGVYLLYSVLVAPAIIGLAARTFGGLAGAVPATVAAFAALSALARSIGILRWLTVMPALAAAHAAAPAAERAQIERLFDAISTYGGGIGEVLGVALFMTLAVGTLCAAAWRRGAMHPGFAATGLVSAALLGGMMIPVFGGPEVVPVAVAVSAVSLWMLAVGVACWRGR
jgi:hypothetical protein